MRGLVIAVLCATFMMGCRPSNVITENGPVIVSQATSLGVIAALSETDANPSDVVLIKRYLLDARGIITDGLVPANALDDIASMINDRINNQLVIGAIQFGIELVKKNVAIPVDGILSDKVKLWVVAMLDGSIDGCDLYIDRRDLHGALPPDMKYRVSFR